MAQKFSAGSIVYAKDGRSYTVEAVDGGTVYCISSNGAETEFPIGSLFSETEWATQSNGRRELSYSRLKQARVYATTGGEKLDSAACQRLLSKVGHVSPSLLDFAAFRTAAQVLSDNKDHDFVEKLSIIKARQLFDEAKPEVRVHILGGLLGVQSDKLLSAAGLGDNLMRAMLEKGLTAHADAFEDFLDRPRR
jgi:hypothetical protein